VYQKCTTPWAEKILGLTNKKSIKNKKKDNKSNIWLQYAAYFIIYAPIKRRAMYIELEKATNINLKVIVNYSKQQSLIRIR
jgi:hypothetical protein